MKTAIIIGGGVAGPLVATALLQAGLHATVYEAHPASAAGAWLTVAVNGLAAMQALGVHGAVKACGFPSRTIELVSGTGKHLGDVPIGGSLPDGTVTHTMKRADLCAAVARNVPIEYEKRLVDVFEDGDSIIARFDDGTEARGDFLIGADGVHSRVRRLIDPEAPAPRYTGLGNVGGFVPGPNADLPRGQYRMIFGRRGFFGYTVAPSGECWWFANPPRETEFDPRAKTDWKAYLCDLFEADDGPAVDLISRTPHALACTNQYDLATVPRWHRGRMLILGDAAHAASPSSGQGVSMAAEDAVALGEAFRTHGAIEAAFTAFELARRARVERVVAYGKRYASTKVVGPVGRFFRDLLLPLAFRFQPKPEALDWLYRAA